MFQIYFRKYQKISKENDDSSVREAIKKLDRRIKKKLVIFVITLVAYTIFESCGLYRIGAFLAVTVVAEMFFLAITPKYRSDTDTEDKEDSAFKFRIEEFEQFLRLKNMYDKDSLRLLIRLCGSELETEKEKSSLSCGSFFAALILAIIKSVAEVAVDGLNPGIYLNLAVIAILVLTLMFLALSWIIPDILPVVFKRRYLLETFGEDLEYILYRCERQIPM